MIPLLWWGLLILFFSVVFFMLCVSRQCSFSCTLNIALVGLFCPAVTVMGGLQYWDPGGSGRHWAAFVILVEHTSRLAL